MRFIIVYAIGLVMLLAACDKKARLDLPYEGDKIVLNTFMLVDSVAYIRVTKSEPVVSSNDPEFAELSNAQVTIQENGRPFSAVHRQVVNGRGYFVSDSVIRPGKRYTVTAAATGLTAVSATDSIPARPEAGGLFAQKTASQVYFTLKDPGEVVNYYRIRLYSADSVDGAIRPQTRLNYRLDPSFNNNFADIISDAYYDDLVIKDERISGKSIVFVLQTSLPITYKYVVADVIGITEQGYRYLKSVDDQQDNQGEDSFLSQPIKVFSNVVNGYGIVAGMYTKRITCKVKE